MDPFTQSILARARERQKMLAEYGVSDDDINIATAKCSASLSQESIDPPHEVAKTKSQSVEMETVPDPTRSDLHSPVSLSKPDDGNKPRVVQETKKTVFVSNCQNVSPLHSKSLSIKRNDFDMEIKLKSSSENVQLQIEIQETDDSLSEHIDIEELSASTLALKPKANTAEKIPDTLQNRIPQFKANSTENMDKVSQDDKENIRTRKGLKCLADLAQNMIQWEDEVKVPRKSSPTKVGQKKSTKPPAPQPPDFKKSENPNTPISVNTPVKRCGTGKSEQSTPIENATTRVGQESQNQLQLDNTLVKTLESQGFTRTTSSSRLIYKYNQDREKTGTPKKILHKSDENVANTKIQDDQVSEGVGASVRKILSRTPNSPSKARSAAIADKAHLFESISSPSKTGKDPALLSVSERRALFEKNKGVVVPKAPFGMAVPIHKSNTPAAVTQGQARKSPLKKNPAPKRPDEIIASQSVNSPVVVKSSMSQGGNMQSKTNSPAVVTSTMFQEGNVASKTAALLEEKATISEATIVSNIRQERQKEMDMLLNRFSKNKGPQISNVIFEETEEDDCDEDTPMVQRSTHKIISQSSSVASPLRKSDARETPNKGKTVSPKVAAVLEDVKRIKVSPAKMGKLYPNLSDIEAATETETEDNREPSPNISSGGDSSFDSSDANNSFRREVIQAVTRNHTPQKRSITDDSDISDILDDTDDGNSELSSLSDENALSGPTPPKQIRSSLKETETQISSSFHFKKPILSESCIEGSRRSGSLPHYVVDDGNILPLQHTVSFYRKQQSQETKTTPKHISTTSVTLQRKESHSSESRLVQDKIKELQEEVNKQHLIIFQTSQAINLCSCTPEFMGSTEQVEAERVLLIATHKRQVVMNELQRLSVEQSLAPLGKNYTASNEKGTLIVSKIELPLKREYVRALAAAGGMGHHIVCLIKCCDKVVAAKLVSTVARDNKTPDFEVKVPGKYTLNDVYSESTITFEVYCLQAQEEMVPHEVKYHINNKKSSSKSTPKKSKQESRLVRPVNESPGGPNAVRSPSFAVMGYVVLSVQGTRKKCWTLNNVPPKSPLDGTVEMCISYQPDIVVEHQGFLTVFEDISGFGAWHRRWYLLKGHSLSYWKYPDDEKRAPPIDTIDLRSCITQDVGPVSREVCARLNTFLVELEREAYPTDKDSLVTVCEGDKTILRHLFSADTKEERIEWCKNINAALRITRALKDGH